MEKTALIKELQALVGEDQVITDEEAILTASKDYIGYRRYERDDGKFFVPRAACVVNVNNTDEVVKVVKFLNENKVDVVPRTGGSSVTRGLEPQEGGVIIDGSGMNEIVEINEKNMFVTVKAGTPLEYLEKVLNEKGLTCGHFPQSFPMASIGGLLATRSIGQFSTLYGGIEDLVVGLEAVIPDGSVVRIKNVPRRSAGPDLRHMFIGSEGALGFITEATLKVFKYQPENRWMAAYAVNSTREGLDFLRDIMVEGYKPAVVRLHDAEEVEKVLKIEHPLLKNKGLIMLLAEGPKEVTKATGKGIKKLAKKHGLKWLTAKPVEIWLERRNEVCAEMDEPVFYKMGAIVDTCEISANWDVIGEIYDVVTTRIRNEVKDCAISGGHSSHSYLNGTNMYFEFGFMEDDGNKAEEDYMNVISIIMEETLKRGGSIAHHHGSGKYRTPWMDQEHGSSYQLMYKLKEALDPNGIFNKGVILK